MESIFERLSKSKFRCSFHLSEADKNYLEKMGMTRIEEQARDFFRRRLKYLLRYDGRQTPSNGHPVYVAQHATATCCRRCMEKWYHIEKDKELNENEVEFFVGLIMAWIRRELY